VSRQGPTREGWRQKEEKAVFRLGPEGIGGLEREGVIRIVGEGVFFLDGDWGERIRERKKSKTEKKKKK